MFVLRLPVNFGLSAQKPLKFSADVYFHVSSLGRKVQDLGDLGMCGNLYKP